MFRADQPWMHQMMDNRALDNIEIVTNLETSSRWSRWLRCQPWLFTWWGRVQSRGNEHLTAPKEVAVCLKHEMECYELNSSSVFHWHLWQKHLVWRERGNRYVCCAHVLRCGTCTNLQHIGGDLRFPWLRREHRIGSHKGKLKDWQQKAQQRRK